MKHNDKRAIIAKCRGEYQVYGLTEEEERVLKERYMSDGTIRMSQSAIATILEIPFKRVINHIDAAIVKIEAYKPPQLSLLNEHEDDAPALPEGFHANHVGWHRKGNGDEFETLDIVLAAGLLAMGYELIELREPERGHKKRIVLRIPYEDVDPLLKRFMLEKFFVDVTVYHGKLKALKNMLYDKYNH